VNNPIKSKILVVDDSETNRMLLRFTLEELEFEVSEASEGATAVELALEHSFSAVLMDINMPTMSGLVAIDMLNRLNYSSPVIACSAEDNQQIIDGYLQKGFAAFVPKPIDPETIAKTLLKLNVSAMQPDTNELEKRHHQKIQELRSRFIQNLPKLIDKLNLAIRTESTEELQRFCHQLKANAGHFGFEKVYSLSKEVEKTIKIAGTKAAAENAKSLLFELHKIDQQ
jgi:CheY-like chemotaxis protein